MTFGESVTEELAWRSDPQRKVTVTCEHGAWLPPGRLAPFLPQGFTVPVDRYAAGEGLRRIVPRCNLEELIDLGAVGGLAVIHGIRGFDRQVDSSYRAMLLLHQHVRGRKYQGTRGMKEHLTREFLYARDLFVRRSGRRKEQVRDVLPEDVGLNARGEGRRLSVAQLIEEGRRAAREAGHTNPVSSQAIAFGLFEAAKRNPLTVADEQVPALVRLALFDIDSSRSADSEELIEIVTERLLTAIKSHLGDSQEAFDRWFTGPKNSLLKQIADATGKRGGRLEREQVRSAFLELGWRAYAYVGQCVHALMRTIKNSMPEPLHDEERRLFETMYESQPYYGDLPLALLAERARFFQPAILAIWDEPQEQNHVRVLHRLLAWYAEMAPQRREADRESKRRCQDVRARTPPGAGSDDHLTDADDAPSAEAASADLSPDAVPEYRGEALPFIDDLYLPAAAPGNFFQDVAEHLRKSHGIECDACCGHWEERLESDAAEVIAISMRCECGRTQRTIKLSREEFAAQAQEVLHWEPPAGGRPATDRGSHPDDSR